MPASYATRTLAEGRLQGVPLAEEGAGGANPVADTGVEEAMLMAA